MYATEPPTAAVSHYLDSGPPIKADSFLYDRNPDELLVHAVTHTNRQLLLFVLGNYSVTQEGKDKALFFSAIHGLFRFCEILLDNNADPDFELDGRNIVRGVINSDLGDGALKISIISLLIEHGAVLDKDTPALARS